MKFLVSFQQEHISVFQLSKFSTPTQKTFPSFPVKDSQAAISVVVSIVVGVHGEAQLPIALEQVIALSDSNPTSFCEHLCESENLTNERPSQISIKHNQIRILLVQTKTGQKHQYTPQGVYFSVKKNVNTLPRVGMNWKIRLPFQYIPPLGSALLHYLLHSCELSVKKIIWDLYKEIIIVVSIFFVVLQKSLLCQFSFLFLMNNFIPSRNCSIAHKGRN